VSQVHPHHDGVKLAQLYQHSPVIKENKEIHISWTIDNTLLGTWIILSGQNLDIKIDLFDTNIINATKDQYHKIDISGNLNLSWVSDVRFDGKLLIISSANWWEHYVFIDEFAVSQSWNKNETIQLRSSLIDLNMKKRIKTTEEFPFRYVQWWWLLDMIDENMTNNRVMQWLDAADIYASEGEKLKTELQIKWNSENITLDFLTHKTLLILKNTISWYEIHWDISKDDYGWRISWISENQISKNKANISLEAEIMFPRGLKLDIQTNNRISVIQEFESDLEIPTRYIDAKKLFSWVKP